MIERVNVQVFIYTLNPFKVLILKRTKERSGYWQPVCGGIDKDESVIDTVKREVVEETGLTTYKRIINLDYSFSYEEPKNEKRMMMKDICFAMEVSKEFSVKLSDEHEQYKWCRDEEVRKYLKWKYNMIAYEKLKKMLLKGM